MLIEKFIKNIEINHLLTKNHRLLLAVSGGMDSMILADLFEKCGYNFSVAHCNFGLRNSESKRDEEFVKNYFTNKGIRVFHTNFKTVEYAEKNQLSIQMAARELRYKWFIRLANENQFDYVITAHHLNDSIETFFINLLRGTGINGLKGIPAKQDKIIRPLLFASSEMIKIYQKENNIPYVEDSSNFEKKYLRNRLRQEIIPVLKEINPHFEEIVKKELEIFSESNSFIKSKIHADIKEMMIVERSAYIINCNKLLEYPFLNLALHYILSAFNFHPSSTSQIKEMVINPQTGKKIIGKTHVLLIDRNQLIFKERKQTNSREQFPIFENTKEISYPINLKINIETGALIEKEKNIACLDLDKLVFPLQLRKWEKGDFYFPIGMEGTKKISDFFINNKYSIFDKEEQWFLVSNNNIVWIIGKRIDRRYMVTKETQKTLKLFLCD